MLLFWSPKVRIWRGLRLRCFDGPRTDILAEVTPKNPVTDLSAKCLWDETSMFDCPIADALAGVDASFTNCACRAPLNTLLASSTSIRVLVPYLIECRGCEEDGERAKGSPLGVNDERRSTDPSYTTAFSDGPFEDGTCINTAVIYDV